MLDYPGRCSGKRSEQAATTGWAASRGLAVAECWTMSARNLRGPSRASFASSVSGASEQRPLVHGTQRRPALADGPGRLRGRLALDSRTRPSIAPSSGGCGPGGDREKGKEGRMPEEGGEVTGTKDKDYNLIWSSSSA